MNPERRQEDRRVGPRDRRQGPRRDEEIRETRRRRVLDSQWTPYALMLTLVVFALWRFDGILNDIRDEGTERRDQTCLLFERQHAAAVLRLGSTYEFLKSGKVAELREAVLASLPQVEADARESIAPEYCDADGVGLPEPNPTIPPRPKTL